MSVINLFLSQYMWLFCIFPSLIFHDAWNRYFEYFPLQSFTILEIGILNISLFYLSHSVWDGYSVYSPLQSYAVHEIYILFPIQSFTMHEIDIYISFTIFHNVWDSYSVYFPLQSFTILEIDILFYFLQSFTMLERDIQYVFQKAWDRYSVYFLSSIFYSAWDKNPVYFPLQIENFKYIPAIKERFKKKKSSVSDSELPGLSQVRVLCQRRGFVPCHLLVETDGPVTRDAVNNMVRNTRSREQFFSI